VLRRPPVRGAVPGLGAVCGRRSGVPAGGAGGRRVPGGTGRSVGEAPRPPGLQVPARFPQRGAVPAHILEGSPAARSVTMCGEVGHIFLDPFVIYTSSSRSRSESQFFAQLSQRRCAACQAQETSGKRGFLVIAGRHISEDII